MLRIVVPLFFLLSGFSGLIYEVAWTRLLTTILGNTIYAVSIVLSAFMAGLSAGSLVAGRFLDSRRDSFKIYAILELCIGASGFCLTLMLNQTGPVYVWIHHALSANAGMLPLWRSVFAFVMLVVPTALMGATLPVLSKFSAGRERMIGMTVGLLYGVNTFGAAAGCFAAGFLFIGSIGILKTVSIASAINISIGAAAWFLRNADITAPPENARPLESCGPEKRAEPALPGMIALAAFAVSGFAAMGYEITWTRMLISYMGNTVYAFSAMLSTFLLGMALGSLTASCFVNRLPKLCVCFGALQIGIGAYITVILYFFGNHLPFLMPFVSPYPVVANIAVMFLKAMALMFVPTVLMGASFPLAARLYATHISAVARRVAELYSWNTIACIIGSIAAGFLLIPRLGFEKSLVAMLVLNVGSGIALFAVEPSMGRPARTGLAVAAALAAAFGVAFIPRDIIAVLHRTIFHKEETTVYYKETPYGVVEVLESPDRRRLLQDDLDLAGTSLAYLASQKPLGHLPMLLHPDPKRVFIIGFGAGGASYAASCYPGVKNISIAELNKDIVAAAPLFPGVNHGVLSDPKCALSINDGRQFLLTTSSRFDVISVDLLWPQSAGAGSLYTKEFYRLCSDRLNEKGVMVEWIHTGLIPKAYVGMIVKTVRQVFPYAALWTSRSFGHFFLVASKDSCFRIDYRSFSKRLCSPGVSRDLSGIGLDKPDVFMSYFIADGAALDSLTGGKTAINTDNLPIIEYKLPFNRNWSWYDNAVGIMRYKRPVLPLLQHIDSTGSRCIAFHEHTMMTVLQSKMDYARGDQWGAITLCTDAFRDNPLNPEAAAWYLELKQTMKCLSDSGKAPPNVLSAFDTSDVTYSSQN